MRAAPDARACLPALLLQARRESFASEVAESSLRAATLEGRLHELRSWETGNKTQLEQVLGLLCAP
jgi:hypothetical protein